MTSQATGARRVPSGRSEVALALWMEVAPKVSARVPLRISGRAANQKALRRRPGGSGERSIIMPAPRTGGSVAPAVGPGPARAPGPNADPLAHAGWSEGLSRRRRSWTGFARNGCAPLCSPTSPSNPRPLAKRSTSCSGRKASGGRLGPWGAFEKTGRWGVCARHFCADTRC